MKIINHESRAGLKQILCRFKVFFMKRFLQPLQVFLIERMCTSAHVCTQRP